MQFVRKLGCSDGNKVSSHLLTDASNTPFISVWLYEQHLWLCFPGKDRAAKPCEDSGHTLSFYWVISMAILLADINNTKHFSGAHHGWDSITPSLFHSFNSSMLNGHTLGPYWGLEFNWMNHWRPELLPLCTEVHFLHRTRKRPEHVCHFPYSMVGSQLWNLKASSRILGLLLRRNCETSLDLKVLCVTWGAIRAICHQHQVKWKVYVCVLFISHLSARCAFLSCKVKKTARTHACLSSEFSRISLSRNVKLMCSCRYCCQLLPRSCLMAK